MDGLNVCDFTNLIYSQTSHMLLNERFSAVWEIRIDGCQKRTRTKRPPSRSLKIKTIRQILLEHSKSKSVNYRVNVESTSTCEFC